MASAAIGTAAGANVSPKANMVSGMASAEIPAIAGNVNNEIVRYAFMSAALSRCGSFFIWPIAGIRTLNRLFAKISIGMVMTRQAIP